MLEIKFTATPSRPSPIPRPEPGQPAKIEPGKITIAPPSWQNDPDQAREDWDRWRLPTRTPDPAPDTGK